MIDNAGPDELLIVSTTVPVEQVYRSPREVIVRFADRPELRADAKRTFRYLVNQDAGCMDATQFVGIVEPCRAPDHSHYLRRGGLHRRGRGIRAHRWRIDTPPARILFSPAARAGSLHREHGTGRDADPRRLPSFGRSRFTGLRGRLAADSGVVGAAAFGALVIASLAVAAPAPSASCDSPRIGFMGPITGDAAFIGKEQLGFSRYAIRKLGGGTIKLVEGDTQFDPARAATVATTFHANPDILAVVGPARSREVLAVAPVFMRADRLPFISGSALDRSLTNGSIPNFFRVVPNDSVQSPTIAKYIRRGLKAKDVFIVDDRSAYSKALAKGVESKLKAARRSRSPARRSARR